MPSSPRSTVWYRYVHQLLTRFIPELFILELVANTYYYYADQTFYVPVKQARIVQVARRSARTQNSNRLRTESHSCSMVFQCRPKRFLSYPTVSIYKAREV
jgi:hypothetical protein